MLISRYKHQKSIFICILLLSLAINVGQSYNVNAKQSNNNFDILNQETLISNSHSYSQHTPITNSFLYSINFEKMSGVSISIGSRSGFKLTIKPGNKYPISAKQAIKIATKKVPGDVLKVKLIKGNYKINILTKKGLQIIYVSATTGKILKLK